MEEGVVYEVAVYRKSSVPGVPYKVDEEKYVCYVNYEERPDKIDGNSAMVHNDIVDIVNNSSANVVMRRLTDFSFTV
jgi:hypothetical protein